MQGDSARVDGEQGLGGPEPVQYPDQVHPLFEGDVPQGTEDELRSVGARRPTERPDTTLDLAVGVRLHRQVVGVVGLRPGRRTVP